MKSKNRNNLIGLSKILLSLFLAYLSDIYLGEKTYKHILVVISIMLLTLNGYNQLEFSLDCRKLRKKAIRLKSKIKKSNFLKL